MSYNYLSLLWKTSYFIFRAQYYLTMNSKEGFEEKIAEMKGEQAKYVKMSSVHEVVIHFLDHFLFLETSSFFEFVFIFQSHFQFWGSLYFLGPLHSMSLSYFFSIAIFIRWSHLHVEGYLHFSFKPKLVTSQTNETIIKLLWNKSKLALSLAQLCPILFKPLNPYTDLWIIQTDQYSKWYL